MKTTSVLYTWITTHLCRYKNRFRSFVGCLVAHVFIIEVQERAQYLLLTASVKGYETCCHAMKQLYKQKCALETNQLWFLFFKNEN